MMIARKSIGIVLVISILVIFGCGKEEEEPKELLQMYPEGVPKEIVSEIDGAEMVLIPTGEFEMGDQHRGLHAGCRPVHTVYLDAFYVDKYEVTVGQYKKFIEATGHRAPDWHAVSKYSPTDEYPIIWVSWLDAAAYAQWAGKRLLTEAQWEKAARGGLVGKKYPWGDSEPDGSNANFADRNWSPTSSFSWSYETVDDGYGFTARVGSYAPNGYGLYDMAGNVWEWCADEYDADYYSISPKNNPTGPGVPVLFVNDDFTNVGTSSRVREKGIDRKTTQAYPLEYADGQCPVSAYPS